ncbi:hypothetical protein Taro_019068 [Colocasia esculenta]|uniref:RNase H type-1 domain-containing protein n=1 Tax=Colocasia esculenta TaxID=4460 RepID=A0A843USG3_COLES|nr:hypothetical protein [Colocasia esculenta]
MQSCKRHPVLGHVNSQLPSRNHHPTPEGGLQPAAPALWPMVYSASRGVTVLQDAINDDWCEDGSDALELERELRTKESEFHKMGYSDGVIAGKEAAAQEGFNAGYKQAVLSGYNWGMCTGWSSNFSEAKKGPSSKTTGFARAKLPIKYLGVSIYTGRQKPAHFANIISRTVKKLQGWKTELLSTGDRLILIQHVLSALPIYTMNALPIPATVVRAFHRLLANFFWGSYEGSPKRHWKNWNVIAQPKESGGLGVINLHHMQIAFRTKMLWRALSTNSLWAKFFRANQVWSELSSLLQFSNMDITVVADGVTSFLTSQEIATTAAGRLIRCTFMAKIPPTWLTVLRQKTSGKENLKANIPSVVRWLTPPQGRLKLNVDGAFKGTSGEAGGGGILHDHEGNMCSAFAKAYYGLNSSLAAEALALRDGISICRRMGASEVLVETDSLQLTQIVTRQLVCPWDLACILQDIAVMTQEFKAEITYAPRETNKVADCLARFALSCTHLVTWASWADLPTDVKELYHLDKVGYPSTRP